MPRACPSMTIKVQHFGAREQGHLPGGDLSHQGLVGAEQQLLAGLAAGVKGARNLRAAEGAVGQRAAVLARERHALSHALVDDVDADLGQAVDVGLARAEVAALDRVVEQTVDAVAVVLVILGGVDAALRRDAVGASRAVLKAERLDVVAEFAQRGGGRAAGQAGANHDDAVLALVGRVDQLHVELALVPRLLDRSGRDSGIQFHASAPQIVNEPVKHRHRNGNKAGRDENREARGRGA